MNQSIACAPKCTKQNPKIIRIGDSIASQIPGVGNTKRRKQQPKIIRIHHPIAVEITGT